MSLLYEQCAQFCENLMVLEEKKCQINTIHQNLKAFSKQTSIHMFQRKKSHVNKLSRKIFDILDAFLNTNNCSKGKANSFVVLYIFSKTLKLIQYTQCLFLKYFQAEVFWQFVSRFSSKI